MVALRQMLFSRTLFNVQGGHALHGQILQQLQYAHQHPMESHLHAVQHEHHDGEGLHHNPHHHSMPPDHLQEAQDGQEHSQHAATGHVSNLLFAGLHPRARLQPAYNTYLRISKLHWKLKVTHAIKNCMAAFACGG